MNSFSLLAHPLTLPLLHEAEQTNWRTDWDSILHETGLLLSVIQQNIIFDNLMAQQEAALLDDSDDERERPQDSSYGPRGP